MNEDKRLPSRAVEQGIELISIDNGLDLIQQWLPDAPDSIRITRVGHCLDSDGDDEFNISCAYPPMDALDQRCSSDELNQVLRIWDAYVEALELPTFTWIGSREVRLRWWPGWLKPGWDFELPTEKQAEMEFFERAEDAICLWQLLRGEDPEKVLGTRFYETFNNIANLEPFESYHGYVFTQQALEDSVFETPLNWLYVLAHANSRGIKTQLTRGFAEGFRRLKASEFPDLSDIAALIEPFSGFYPDAALTPDQNARASKVYEIATTFLDRLLSDRLNEVNTFVRACEKADRQSADTWPPTIELE